MGRLIKVFFVIVSVIFLAVLAFVATFDANNYKPQIIEQVENATGRTFIIEGDINLSVFPWIGLKVEGVSLGNETGFEEKTFAAIKQIDVMVNVMPLLKKEVEINTIRLNGLNVYLEIAKNKSNNWSSLSKASDVDETEKQNTDKPIENNKAVTSGKAPPAEESFSPLQSLKVEGFEFVDAMIHYHDRSSDTKATVSELNLTTSAITFDEPIDVQFGARIENNQPVIDARLKLNTQLTFNKDVTKFDLQDFIFTITAKANEFISQPEEIEIKSDIAVSIENQSLVLKGLQLSALGTTTLAEITVSQFLQTPTIQGSIEVQTFNARQVAKRVAIDLPPMSKADALQRVAIKTVIKLSGEKFQANKFNLTLDDSTLIGWIRVLDISKQQLRYDLIFDKLNINDYMPPVVEPVTNQVATNNIESESAAEANRNAAVEAGNEQIELPIEMMRKLDIEGDFKIASLTAKEYQIKNFLMRLKAHKGLINIKPLSLQVLQGKVDMGLVINVQKTKPSYAIKLDVNQVQIAPVANPFLVGAMGNKPLKMKGAVNVIMNVKTSGDSINQLKRASKGKIIFDMRRTEVNGFDPEFYMRSSVTEYIDSKGLDMSKTIMGNYKPREVTVFDKIYSTINLAKGKARTNDFLMSSKRVKVTAKGYVDIMKNSLDVISSVSLPRGKTVVEKILDDPMFVRVYGFFDALQYKLDTDRLKKSTTNVLKNQAKEKLNAEKKRLKVKLDAEKQRIKAKVDAERRRVKEKVKKKKKKERDKLKKKLKDKFKGLL
ncbi:hypothetical protein MNBD_GAMMA06-2133 [hydrothermal vent metagenome]|uniref:AsmA domain-containing protein n=1 Tax=hydrothermal vent metagenome TaxID=652676 RepID=A0A3B0X526_9ZZZZ